MLDAFTEDSDPLCVRKLHKTVHRGQLELLDFSTLLIVS